MHRNGEKAAARRRSSISIENNSVRRGESGSMAASAGMWQKKKAYRSVMAA